MRAMSAGHAAVDAMVAMLIVSLAIVLSLRAVRQSERAASLALETRRAETLLKDLMLEGPGDFQPASGSTGGFAWTVQTLSTGAARPIAVCRRLVTLTSASARRYSAATLGACPDAAPG